MAIGNGEQKVDGSIPSEGIEGFLFDIFRISNKYLHIS